LAQCSASSTDANYINANFKTETDKIRAVLLDSINISYDVPGMFDLNVNETVPEKIAKALKEKRSLCSLCCRFNDLAKVGIQSYIIEGYTKQYGK
jgi:hypothetical protein